MTIYISQDTARRIENNYGKSIDIYTRKDTPFLRTLEMVNAVDIFSNLTTVQLSQIKSINILFYSKNESVHVTLQRIINVLLYLPAVETITLDNIQEWITFDIFIESFLRQLLIMTRKHNNNNNNNICSTSNEVRDTMDTSVIPISPSPHLRQTIHFVGPMTTDKYDFNATICNGDLESIDYFEPEKINNLFITLHGYTNNFRCLKLTNKGLHPRSVLNLASFIEDNVASTLTHLDLGCFSFNSQGDSFDQLKDTLVNKCHELEYLAFRSCSFGRSKTKMLKDLVSVLPCTVKTLHLSKNELYYGEWFWDVFYHSKFGTTIESLHASFCFDTDDVTSLKQLLDVLASGDTTLRELDLGSFTSDGCKALNLLCKYLPHISCLKSLRFQYDMMTSYHMEELLQALTQCLSLTSITIECPQLQYIITPKLKVICNRNQLLQNLDRAIRNGIVPRKVIAHIIKTQLDLNVRHDVLFRFLMSNAWAE